MNRTQELNTDQMFALLEAASSFESVERQVEVFDGLSFVSYLGKLLLQYGMTIPQVVQRSLLSKSYVYQIFDGAKQPGRDTVLRIAIAVGCTLDETQRLLKLAGKGALYPKLRRDAALIFCLKQGYSLLRTADFLEDVGEAALL